jgi:hypothetical protein
LEAHTFACPCGGTLKACWPENIELARLVAAKIPVFGEPNRVNELAASISTLPIGIHHKLMTYCLNGNNDLQLVALSFHWRYLDANLSLSQEPQC